MLEFPFLDRAIFKHFQSKSLGDGSDRLSSSMTTTLCTLFAIMVTTKQYVGSPITCWTPSEFTGTWHMYAREYCFIQNTYIVPLFERLPFPAEMRTSETVPRVNYYQWMPFILFLQSLSFFLPNFIWKKINKLNGFDITDFVMETKKIDQKIDEKRQAEIRHVSQVYVDKIFHSREENPLFGLSRFSGSSIAVLYFLTKVLYVLNAGFQFYMVTKMLNADNDSWALKAVQNIIMGRPWVDSACFPRVTMCDFHVRTMGNTNNYTVQCLLMLNMINEKIFLFQWYWFAFVMIVCGYSVFQWSMSTFSSRARKDIVKNWLRSTDLNCKAFTRLITTDGFVVLYFIQNIAGKRIVGEIISESIRIFKQKNIPDIKLDGYLDKPNNQCLPKVGEVGEHSPKNGEAGALPEKKPIESSAPPENA